MTVFDWKEFYNVGNHLKNYSKEEAYQRSAICRYYHSCFGPVKKYYEQSFRKILCSKEAHINLIKALKESPFIEEQRLGKKLDELRKNRNFADYKSGQLNNNLVHDSKKYAEEIFMMLNWLYTNPLRLMKT
jgi:hypothetical protein